MLPQLIETLHVDSHGDIALLDQHLDRLIGASICLGYICPEAQVQDAIQTQVAALPRGVAHRLRLLLDRHGNIELEPSPLAPLAPAQRLALSSRRLASDTILLRYKTTHRPWFKAATAWLATHSDYFDVLFLNEQGQLCEGSRSNVYLLCDGQWWTPPVEAGLLPGVQRAQLLASEQVAERVLTLDDLRRAQGVRLSNALRGWFNVVCDPVDVALNET